MQEHAVEGFSNQGGDNGDHGPIGWRSLTAIEQPGRFAYHLLGVLAHKVEWAAAPSKVFAMDVLAAAVCTVIVLVISTRLRLFLWKRRQNWPRERQMHRQVDAALAEQHAHRQFDAARAEQSDAHRKEMFATRRAIAAGCGEMAALTSRQVDVALTEHRAALQQEMDAQTKGANSETVTQIRDDVLKLRTGMREMQRGLRVPDERVHRPGSEQRAADFQTPIPGALVAPSSRRAADAADVPALPTDSASFGASRLDRRSLESRRSSSASKPPVAPAENVAQHTIRYDDPRHATQAGPPAAAGPSARSSHDQHVRVDPIPATVSGISRGGTARVRREARRSQSPAPALPQSSPPIAGARFYEEASSSVTRAPAPAADSEAPVTPLHHRAASGIARAGKILLIGTEQEPRVCPGVSCGGFFYSEMVRRYVRKEHQKRSKDEGRREGQKGSKDEGRREGLNGRRIRERRMDGLS